MGIMVDDGSLPSVPDNAKEIYNALSRALGDLNPTQEERDAIATYVGREIPPLLDTRVTAYLVLGSYRNSFHQRLRAVQHELGNRRTDTRAIVLGDTAEMPIDERAFPAFDVKFHLLAATADLITMVMEKESGGEGPELGRIADEPYLQYSHVLPRDFVGFTTDNIDSLAEARKAATEIWFNDHESAEEKTGAIDRLIDQCEFVTNPGEIYDFLDRRDREDSEPPAYSWVHLSAFRKFERVDRCHPWMTEEELRAQAQALPGPDQPDWPSRTA